MLKTCNAEQDILLSILDTFRLDPLTDWAVDRVESGMKRYFDAYSALAQFWTTITVTEMQTASLEEQFDSSIASFAELCKRTIELIPLVYASQVQYEKEKERQPNLIRISFCALVLTVSCFGNFCFLQNKARNTQIATEEVLSQFSQDSERELELLALLARGEEAQENIHRLRESPRLLREYFSSIRDFPALADIQSNVLNQR